MSLIHSLLRSFEEMEETTTTMKFKLKEVVCKNFQKKKAFQILETPPRLILKNDEPCRWKQTKPHYKMFIGLSI